MDIKAEIEKAVAKITGDNSKIDAFKKDPVGTVKSVLGAGAAKDLIDKVVSAVKAALGSGGIGDVAKKAAGGVGDVAKKAGDAIGGLFGKKDN
ncbi:MAG: hypothetical protein IKG80_04930 [Clostridia bacterium]|nr:hypothetical protein [Clostridia bacterium]